MPKKNKKPRIENIEINTKNQVSDKVQDNNLEKDNKKNKKTKKKHKILKIVLILFLILLILGIAIFSAYLVKSKGNVTEAALDIVTDFVGEQDPIFVLILGVSEDISVALTDTIMLAGYNPQTQNAFVVSIPRDTYVGKNQKYANGYDKINAKYQSGYESTITAVEELTGVTIDYYVLIKNNALIDVVDSIGGVKFDVPIDMDYDDITQNLHIHLKSGLQTLTGEQAEQLVRFRHNNDGSSYPSSYGDNDYGRMRTQREFIKTLAKQLISLDNVPKVKEIATAVFDNLETDITLSKALAYVPFGLKLDVESNLTMIQLPGQSNLVNELWFYVPNYEEIADLFDELVEKLELEDDFKQSHYKRITKSNIKIVNTNKKDEADKKEEVEVKSENTITNTIIEQPIINTNINDNKITIDNNTKIETNEVTTNTAEKTETTNTNVTNSVSNNTVNNQKENTSNNKNTSNSQNVVKNETINTSTTPTTKPSTEGESTNTAKVENKVEVKEPIKTEETKTETTKVENTQTENT